MAPNPGWTAEYLRREYELLSPYFTLPATDGQKAAGRAEFRKALSQKKVERQARCTICKSESRAMEAHHRDYSKPLNVMWVCSMCHAGIHALQRAAQRAAG